MLTLLSLAWLLFASPLAYGQSLHVSSVGGAPGETVAVGISLDAPVGKEPTALKWVTIFPAQLLEVEGNGPSLSSAAAGSGKSLTCAMRKAYTYVCILAGGNKPVGSGAIAIFHFKIQPEARKGPASVRVEQGEAVSADAGRLSLTDAEGLITVR
jgi:hypothetical protein